MVELVQVVFPREDGFVGQHLSQDAAHRPDVNGLWVALRHKHTHLAQLWFLSFIYRKLNKLKRKKKNPSSVTHSLTLELSMISGALYQRVATYSVKKPVWSCSGSAIRARPKSQIWQQHRGSEVKNSSLPAGPEQNSRVSESSEACSESYFRFRCSFLLCLICMQHSYFKWFWSCYMETYSK